MIKIIIIILIFLFLRKNCNIVQKEKFNNININHKSSDKYFHYLQNNIKQKQSVRNLLF